MKDKMILITQHATAILLACILFFWGLDGSVWRDAPRASGVAGFILGTLLLVTVITNSCLTVWKKRRVKKGLEQWPDEGKVHRTLRKWLPIIVYLITVTFIVMGVVFENPELSGRFGMGLVFVAIVHIASVLSERDKKREQSEKDQGEDSADDTKE